jgi:hypothetical protein
LSIAWVWAVVPSRHLHGQRARRTRVVQEV